MRQHTLIKGHGRPCKGREGQLARDVEDPKRIRQSGMSQLSIGGNRIFRSQVDPEIWAS